MITGNNSNYQNKSSLLQTYLGKVRAKKKPDTNAGLLYLAWFVLNKLIHVVL